MPFNRMIECSNELNKKKIKIILDDYEKKLDSKSSGAKVLLKKLQEIE